MAIDAQTAFRNSIRGVEIVQAVHNKMIFSQQIQDKNTMLPWVNSKAVDSTQIITTKDFQVEIKRTNPQTGITDGELSGTQYERYSYGLENFYHMAGMDITDKLDRPFDVHARLNYQLRKAESRLMAKLCLKGLFNPIKTIANGTVNADTRAVTADITPTVRKWHNCWYDQEATGQAALSAVTNLTNAYDPIKFYSNLRKQFRKREISSPLCVLATPYLMDQLERFTGKQYQPWGLLSNQVCVPFEKAKYNDLGGLNSFMWRGFRHVCVFQSHMPDPKMFEDQDTVANKPFVFKDKFTKFDEDIQAPARDLSSDSVFALTPYTVMTEDNTAAIVNAKSYVYRRNGPNDGDNITTAMTGTFVDVKTQLQYVTWVWSPMHLNFVYAPAQYIRGMSDRIIRLLGARLWLNRYSMGAYRLNPEFDMTVFLKVKKAA